MKLANADTYICDNCRESVPETYYVKFPAVDVDQEQEFCDGCAKKFVAWRAHKITIGQLFDRTFKMEEPNEK